MVDWQSDRCGLSLLVQVPVLIDEFYQCRPSLTDRKRYKQTDREEKIQTDGEEEIQTD